MAPVRGASLTDAPTAIAVVLFRWHPSFGPCLRRGAALRLLRASRYAAGPYLPHQIVFGGGMAILLAACSFFLGFGRPEEKTAGGEGIVPIAARAI